MSKEQDEDGIVGTNAQYSIVVLNTSIQLSSTYQIQLNTSIE